MEEQKHLEQTLQPTDEELFENFKLVQFTDKENEQEWSCPICTMLVYDPVSCENCDPLYCRRCVRHNLNKKCPTCNQESEFRGANLKLKNIMMKITLEGCPHIKCDKHQAFLTYEQILAHFKEECEEFIMKCPKGCLLKDKKTEIAKHLENC